MFSGGGVFELDGVGGELGVAGEEEVGGVFAVDGFHLGFEGFSGEVEFGGDAGGAELLRELEVEGPGGVGLGDEVDEAPASGFGEFNALGFEGDEEAFEAGTEADAGGGFAAEGFDEVVVAPPPTYR